MAVLQAAALVAAWWGCGAPQGAGLGLAAKKRGCEEPESPWQGAAAVGEEPTGG